MAMARGKGYDVPDAGAVPMPSRLSSRPAVEHFSNDGDDEVTSWDHYLKVALNTSCDLEALSGQLVDFVGGIFDEAVPKVLDGFIPQTLGQRHMQAV